ncbi:MAG TPA: DUF4190 domain-containing protein [Egibacteraceae bacterium]|nr:DUF4190 domain-containing protein [Egibacteraceae bacterium]
MSQPPQTPPPPPWDGGGSSPGGQATWDAPSAPPPQRGSNGVAIASLVCGIIALLLSWIPLINVLALILAIVAVVTGVMGIRRANQPGVGQKGLAIGGLVTGILGALLSVAILLAVFAAFSDPQFREPFERLMEGEDPERVIEDLERQLEDEQR